MEKRSQNQPKAGLQFLKLGGSLITEKTRPHTPRPDVLQRLAGEIAAAYRDNSHLRLVLGHGAGSFGHVPANRYHTRQGVHSAQQWLGFLEVWREEMALNRLVMEALHDAGLPVIALAPVASVSAAGGQVAAWDLGPLRAALQAGLLPVVYGDVVFDREWGGTILSTEDLFAHLALHLRPRRLLLAGLESGVWADYPACTRLIEEIRPDNLNEFEGALTDSAATDVTGGMASKVRQTLSLTQNIPGLEVLIFSGQTPGALQRALTGGIEGTRIFSRR